MKSKNINLEDNLMPSFIGIGGQRCGSSWLYWNLCEHPQIKMSAKKEVNFFSKLIDEKRIVEYYQYFHTEHQVRGEISPSYSGMYMNEVSLTYQLIPDLKVIFIVRNPVERIVSQITRKITFELKNKKNSIGAISLLRLADSGLSVRLTDYGNSYKRWEKFYGKENILLEKYDSLRDDKRKFIKNILLFLEIDENFVFPSKVFDEQKNSSSEISKQQIPNLIRWYLAYRWIAKVKVMHQDLDLDLSDWIADLENVLASKRWYYPVVAIFHILYFYLPYSLFYRVVSYIKAEIRVFRSKRNVAAFLAHSQYDSSNSSS